MHLHTRSLKEFLTNYDDHSDIFHTPELYNHEFGNVEIFKINKTNKQFAFIKIPKCMTTALKDSVLRSGQCTPLKSVDTVPLLDDTTFFTIVRPEYERMYSGVREWRSVNPYAIDKAAGYSEEAKQRIVPLDQRQSIEFHDIINSPGIWDEHVEPQLSYLAPFITLGIPFKMFKLNGDINKNLNNMFEVDIMNNNWEHELHKRGVSNETA